jgi:hypothetical protein
VLAQASPVLDEHLDEVERDLLPLVPGHVTQAEWDALHKRARGSAPANPKTAFTALGRPGTVTSPACTAACRRRAGRGVGRQCAQARTLAGLGDNAPRRFQRRVQNLHFGEVSLCPLFLLVWARAKVGDLAGGEADRLLVIFTVAPHCGTPRTAVCSSSPRRHATKPVPGV